MKLLINRLLRLPPHRLCYCFNHHVATTGTTDHYPTSMYDMVIVGGGMVGFAMAALMAHSPFLQSKQVLLLESCSRKPYVMKEEYEARVVALNITSQKMLEDIGAWDFIKSKRLQPVKSMKVWECESEAFLTFDRDPLAHIVENNLVSESLRLSAESKPSSVTVSYDTLAEQIELPDPDRSDQPVRVKIKCSDLSEPYWVETNLLVGSDGVQSRVRKAANLYSVGWNHGQSAIVATLCLNQPNEQFTAWQRFLPTGPLALLPLSAKHTSLVWSTTNDEAKRLIALSDADFLSELNETLTRPSSSTGSAANALARLGGAFVDAIGYFCDQTETEQKYEQDQPAPPHIEGLQPNTSRFQYPLAFRHATFYHAPRLALVGDAAHRILPLAGQGVNLGFGDVLSLLNHLEQSVQEGADIGSLANLKDYTTDRQRAVIPVAATMEALNLLYSTDAYMPLCIRQSLDQVETINGICQLGARFLATLRAASVQMVQSNALIKNFLLQSAITGRIGIFSSDSK